MMTPIDHTSHAAVYCLPEMTSGATYPGVPHGVAMSAFAAGRIFAKPRSASLMVVSSVRDASSTFSGFKSRWQMCRACAVATPATSCCATARASRSE